MPTSNATVGATESRACKNEKSLHEAMI